MTRASRAEERPAESSGTVHVLEVITGLDVGGAEVQLLKRVPLLRAAGIEVTVAALRAGPLRERFELAGARVVEFRSRALLDPRPGLGIARLIREHRVDVVHCHLFRARLWGVPVARLLRVPLVLQSEHALASGSFESRRHNFLNRLMGIVLGRLAHRTIAVSRNTARLLRTLHRVPAGRIVYVANGVCMDEFASERNVEPVMDITALGRLQESKGFGDLIQAVAILHHRGRRISCEIGGTGPLGASYQAMIEGLGLDDAVRLVGVRHDVGDFVRRGRVFAVPSRCETFGIAALEAMAAGVPVVATRVDALPELIVDGETGLLAPPNNPPALAAALSSLLEDPDRRARFAKAGQAVARKFDLERSTWCLVELYSAGAMRQAVRDNTCS